MTKMWVGPADGLYAVLPECHIFILQFLASMIELIGIQCGPHFPELLHCEREES